MRLRSGIGGLLLAVWLWPAGLSGAAAAPPGPGDAVTSAVTVLSLADFVAQATRQDTRFESILLNELTLQYQKALGLPAGDLVLAVKGQYDYMFSQDREEPNAAVSLSKLFPYSGTTITAGYETTTSLASLDNSSEVTFSLSQPIAQNAFGRATRLKDKIIGVETDVARHQIVEAYEDYLAVIMTAYYQWYEAYEAVKVGESTYKENLKLLDNIQSRQQSSIALPIDVNKIRLQVIEKKERLIALQETYQNIYNTIQRALRYRGAAELIPAEPQPYVAALGDFTADYQSFQETSRTCQILRLLEEQSTLTVDREADDLLPSINLLAGYKVRGDEPGLTGEDNLAYAGVSLDWPLGHQVDGAEYEVARISRDQTRLDTISAYDQLYTDIKNLYLQIQRERDLLAIADEKIELARAVLDAEAENYSFGKVTLNDYISAVNAYDSNRFNRIAHDSFYKRLLIERARLMDQLIMPEAVLREPR